MKLGTLDINKAYLGSTEIIKAYLGSNLIFDNTQPGPTPIDYLDYFDIVGSPTDNQGIISGFSPSNYVTPKNPPSADAGTDLVIFLKTPETVSSGDQALFGHSYGGYYPDTADIGLSISNGYFFYYDGYNQAYMGEAGSVQPNTKYIVRFITTQGSDSVHFNHKLYHIVDTGYTKNTLPPLTEWTLDAEINESTMVLDYDHNPSFGFAYAHNQYFAGEIDFNNSYLKTY